LGFALGNCLGPSPSLNPVSKLPNWKTRGTVSNAQARPCRQLCDILLINIWGLWSILDFPRIPTAFAASPTSRARLRDGAAEFGDGSATPEFFSASALRRQSLIIKVDTLIFTARLISASVHPAPTASVHPASLSIALSVLDSIALSVSFLQSDTLGVQWLSLSRYSA
jgi:hypothetical protein